MVVEVLEEQMKPPLWRRVFVPKPGKVPRRVERLARKLEEAERAGLEAALEVTLTDWDTTVVFHDVIAGITWKNPRTGAKIHSHGIYYDDLGRVLQSEWAL